MNSCHSLKGRRMLEQINGELTNVSDKYCIHVTQKKRTKTKSWLGFCVATWSKKTSSCFFVLQRRCQLQPHRRKHELVDGEERGGML